jgi:hypothetical protein
LNTLFENTLKIAFFPSVADAGWGPRGLNNKDLELELEINGDLRLNNRNHEEIRLTRGCSPGRSALLSMRAPVCRLGRLKNGLVWVWCLAWYVASRCQLATLAAGRSTTAAYGRSNHRDQHGSTMS